MIAALAARAIAPAIKHVQDGLGRQGADVGARMRCQEFISDVVVRLAGPIDQQPQLNFDALGGQLWKCRSILAVAIDVAITVDRGCPAEMRVKDIGARWKVSLLH